MGDWLLMHWMRCKIICRCMLLSHTLPFLFLPAYQHTQTPLLLTPTVHQGLPCEVNQLLQQLGLPPFAFRIMHRNSMALYLKFLFNCSAGYIVPLHFRHSKGLTPSCFIHHFCPPSSVHQENFKCIFCIVVHIFA